MALAKLANGVLGPRLTASHPASSSTICASRVGDGPVVLDGAADRPRPVRAGPLLQDRFELEEHHSAQQQRGIPACVDSPFFPLFFQPHHRRSDRAVGQVFDRRAAAITPVNQRSNLVSIALDERAMKVIGQRGKIQSSVATTPIDEMG